MYPYYLFFFFTFNSIINLMDLISVFLQYTFEFVKYDDISDWLVQFQNL